MNRLLSELHRLYPPAPPGHTRTLLLELARPADWAALGPLWRGVQADLALPAPAIAVSGTDGLQLWFSLQQPVASARAGVFLAGLQARYLADVAPARLRLLTDGPLPPMPAQDATSGNWSAFIAPDLAPVFADTPWLDIPPGADGQADLLGRLAGIPPAAFDAALQALQPATLPVATAPRAPAAPAGGDVDPRQFLQRVLNDESAPLALRVDAARTLLLHP
ncbi:hypothetical protein [Roseateles sp. LKC17W]|uniref:DUF721 domain-containing protein n=1 Tax=Pelomonas margarita TaxID=3299031 RepID=A0ABW7FEH1_9BURK